MTRRRPPQPLSYLGVVLAFMAGAALTWVFALALPRLRRSPIPMNDEAIERLVRSQVSQMAPHPEEIDVSVENGIVRVSGRLAREVRERLLHAVIDLPGVVRVRNAISSFPPGPA